MRASLKRLKSFMVVPAAREDGTSTGVMGRFHAEVVILRQSGKIPNHHICHYIWPVARIPEFKIASHQ